MRTASAVPATDSDAWIRRFHPAPDSRVRLFCFPHAGGSANFYLPASRLLAPAVEVLAIQYPGRQDRRSEAPIDNIPDLADHVFHAVRTVTDRPFALWGHSMGAVLAFEVALRLQRHGLPAPVRLFASGRRAPSCHRAEHLHEGGDEAIVAELKSLGATASTLLSDPELRAMILPAVRADYRAIETYRYRPGPPLGCPVTVLVGDSDQHVTLDEARAWADRTIAETDLHVFPGGHFFLVDQVAQVVDRVSDRLVRSIPGE
jgi:surfactin synthase thioesterase subunit